ncbi:hypothetical protein PPERSA_03350 [Pseudocohnilembus persalinus]|uniref:C2H2-type domain-containing protein n=1 Tax=Pseudocohnilembus persalinus TaxID=266149 RepID=A0A0V0R1F5_PSEPJ|nr:hypothetical protein PPERSA_03350 [Pseudocohnilembus persalinus]|eukprot:KRX08356.1 hypothetical protein PPERSA_03350 [Pseudocohnilembus persalinus]
MQNFEPTQKKVKIEEEQQLVNLLASIQKINTSQQNLQQNQYINPISLLNQLLIQQNANNYKQSFQQPQSQNLTPVQMNEILNKKIQEQQMQLNYLIMQKMSNNSNQNNIVNINNILNNQYAQQQQQQNDQFNNIQQYNQICNPQFQNQLNGIIKTNTNNNQIKQYDAIIYQQLLQNQQNLNQAQQISQNQVQENINLNLKQEEVEKQNKNLIHPIQIHNNIENQSQNKDLNQNSNLYQELPQQENNLSKSVSSNFNKEKSSNFSSKFEPDNLTEYSTTACFNNNINQNQETLSESQKYGNKNFTCQICLKSYSSKSYMNKHINEVHQQSKRQCNFCKKDLMMDHHQFILHQQQCDRSKNCPHCDKKGMNFEERDEHILKQHPEQFLQREQEMFLECSICHKKNFKTYGILKQHMKKQHKQLNLKCQQCGKDGFCRITMIQHFKTHHQYDKKCQICGLSNLSQAQLDEHLQKNHQKSELLNSQSGLFDQNSNQIEENTKKQQKNSEIAKVIKMGLDQKQKKLFSDIQSVNDSQLKKYVLKRSSYTQKINQILNL